MPAKIRTLQQNTADGRYLEATFRCYASRILTQLEPGVGFEDRIRRHDQYQTYQALLKENDKTPNYDGYLELTNANGIPTGKIDVQLKTLPENFYDKPRFSYEKPFIAACFQNLHPPILIAVNIKEKIAYWHHVGMETVIDFFSVPGRKSHIIPFHTENAIDGTNDHYIEAWQTLYDIVLESKLLSASQKARIEQLEIEAKEVAKYVEIANLPGKIVEEIHRFLDIYNSLLERDFKAIRKILYPNYWKIGMAIGVYSTMELSYLMLPVPCAKNDPLIMQFKHLPSMDLFNLFQTHGVRAIVMHNDKNPIISSPLKYAYEKLSDEITSTIEKETFLIDDTYAANEYLIGFIDIFTKYLGYEPLASSYDLDDLKSLLETIIPAYESTNQNYKPESHNHYHHIDTYTNSRLKLSNRQALQVVKDLLKTGYEPAIRITLRSDLFDLNLVTYYMNYLHANGQKNIIRQLLANKLERGIGMVEWQTWDRSILLENIKTFVENYPRVYTGLIKKNFPILADQLSLEEEPDLTIYTILFEQDPQKEPLLQKFSLKANESIKESQILFFHERNCPINARDLYNCQDYNFNIGDKSYYVTNIKQMRLNFLFGLSPAFVCSHETLKEKMKSYLDYTIKSVS